MPRPNNRSYNSNNSSRNNSSRSSGKRNYGGRKQDTRASKFGKDNFNMLNFGQAFLDETPDKSFEFKARVMLKTKDGELVDVIDGDGKGDNEYTPEESAMLIAKALLEGRAINICFFAQDDGSWGGNARIDIKGLETDEDEADEEEEEQPKPRAKKTTAKKPATKAKPVYEIPQADDDDEELEETEEDDSEDDEPLPYQITIAALVNQG